MTEKTVIWISVLMGAIIVVFALSLAMFTDLDYLSRRDLVGVLVLSFGAIIGGYLKFKWWKIEKKMRDKE